MNVEELNSLSWGDVVRNKEGKFIDFQAPSRIYGFEFIKIDRKENKVHLKSLAGKILVEETLNDFMKLYEIVY